MHTPKCFKRVDQLLCGFLQVRSIFFSAAGGQVLPGEMGKWNYCEQICQTLPSLPGLNICCSAAWCCSPSFILTHHNMLPFCHFLQLGKIIALRFILPLWKHFWNYMYCFTGLLFYFYLSFSLMPPSFNICSISAETSCFTTCLLPV